MVIVAALLMLWAARAGQSHQDRHRDPRGGQDQAAASLMGVNVNRMISMTFLIGGAMGGAAGVLFGIQYSLINPYTGFIPGSGLHRRGAGRHRQHPGRDARGLVLGLLEAFAASYCRC